MTRAAQPSPQPSPRPSAAAARLLPAGSFVVSCQADPGSPFEGVPFIVAFARAAARGGADALRLQGADTVAAVRADSDLPIIGLVKRAHPEHAHIYITPEIADVADVAAAGAEIVAFDATLRPRPAPVAALVEAAHAAGALAMADVATAAEAHAAVAAGADLVSTTLSGYTADSPAQPGPDLDLVQRLAADGLAPVAEGRIRTPAEAVAALAAGAHAVVVGSAITRPDVVARWFADALGRPDPT